MITSLRTRLMATYAAIAFFSFAVLTLGANLFLESQFSQFVRDRIAQDQKQTLQVLADAWSNTVAWSAENLDIIGMNALERGYVLRISDSSGEEVWNATTHNDGMCQQMLSSMAKNMGGRYPGWNGSYREDAFPIQVSITGGQSATVGTAWVGYYGPFFYNDSEVYFLASLNHITLFTGLAALVVAGFFGFLMAGWLSKPIRALSTIAHRLREGDLEARSPHASGVREIRELALSFNALGQSLGEQEFLRRRLTQDVSHELRTPLTTLQGSLEAMIDGLWVADKPRLESCREEVMRLARLVAQIENLSRVEMSDRELRLKTIDSHAFLAQLCATFEADFASKGVKLSFSADPISFSADPDKLSQILVNVIANALKFTDSGGSVDVRAYRQPANAQTPALIKFEVEDTGIGIAPEHLPHIFERFYRTDESRNRAIGGAGIGLTIAKALAMLHGGDIVVQSQVGQGTTFVVTVPFRQ